MEIFFINSKVEKLLLSEKQLRKKFDERMVERIQKRLAMLEAADNLKTYCEADWRCHELKGDRNGQLAIDLIHPKRLIIAPHPPVCLLDDGGLDRMKTTKIDILEIVDYH